MPQLEGRSFHLELPEGWALLQTPVGRGASGAPAAEIARADGMPESVRIAFGVFDHPPDAMITVMWKRTFVAFDKLEPELTEVGGRQATLVCWTDGVHDLASWFVEEPDALIEFCCTGPGLTDPHGEMDPAERNPSVLGRRILESLRWTAREAP